MPAWNALQVAGLAHGKLDSVGRGVHQGLDDLGHGLYALQEAGLVEEAVIHRDIKAAVGLGVEQAFESEFFHDRKCA